MPTNKDLKRLIRGRMNKTGEAYTSARAQLLTAGRPKKTPVAEYAAVAGMSDEAVQAKTGRNWRQWVVVLDEHDASGLSHRDIARLVRDQFETGGWWAQTITVGYERIRGLREVGQQRGGTYDANKSKTLPVAVARLYKAFSTKRIRERWLPGVALKIRSSAVDKSMRMTWPDGTKVDVYFTAKTSTKSQVAVQHRGLATSTAMTDAKVYWAERLTALGQLLRAS